MSKFTKNERLLLLTTALYTCAITMANVFSNVYLFSYTNSIEMMSLYTACKCACMFLAFLCLTPMMKHKGITICMKIGLLALILTFFLILYMQTQFSNLWVVLGVGCLWGFGEGGFYASMNSFNQLGTDKQTRLRYVGVSGALNALLSVLSPLLASFCVLIMDTDIQGYQLSFQFVIVLFVSMMFVVQAVKVPALTASISRKDETGFLTSKPWRAVCTTNFLQGFRESISFCVTGLLIFQSMLQNSSLYAGILALFSVVAVLSNAIISRYGKPKSFIKMSVIGAIGVFFSGMILVVQESFFTAFLHGITHNLFVPILTIPITIYTMNTLQSSIEIGLFSKSVLVREGYLEGGRVAGLIIYSLIRYLIPDSNILSFVILYSSALIQCWYVVRRKQLFRMES